MGEADHNQFRLHDPLLPKLQRQANSWVKEQTPLFEATCLALAFHVVMLPVLYVLGWLLPWPKAPVITTIFEYNLDEWPKKSKPDKVINVRYPELNK